MLKYKALIILFACFWGEIRNIFSKNKILKNLFKITVMKKERTVKVNESNMNDRLVVVVETG